MNAYYVFMIISIILAICILFSISECDSNNDKLCFVVLTISFIALSVTFYKLGNWQYHKDYINDTKIYTTKLEQKQYSEKLTKINGVYNDKIDTGDNGYYYINKDSEIINFDDFKSNDKVDIYYIEDANKHNIIIKIKKLN